jgi:hypothetical protein
MGRLATWTAYAHGKARRMVARPLPTLPPLTPRQRRIARCIVDARLASRTPADLAQWATDTATARRIGAVTPDEIVQRSAEIRARWDTETCRRRAGLPTRPDPMQWQPVTSLFQTYGELPG